MFNPIPRWMGFATALVIAATAYSASQSHLIDQDRRSSLDSAYRFSLIFDWACSGALVVLVLMTVVLDSVWLLCRYGSTSFDLGMHETYRPRLIVALFAWAMSSVHVAMVFATREPWILLWVVWWHFVALMFLNDRISWAWCGTRPVLELDSISPTTIVWPINDVSIA